VKVREPHSLARHPVEVGRPVRFVSVRAEVGVTEVVCEDENDVGPIVGAQKA
jgi:hypothetical protein